LFIKYSFLLIHQQMVCDIDVLILIDVQVRTSK